MKKKSSYSIASILFIMLCVLTVKAFIVTNSSLSREENAAGDMLFMVQSRCIERNDAVRRWAIAVEGMSVMAALAKSEIIIDDSVRVSAKVLSQLLAAQNRKIEALKTAESSISDSEVQRNKARVERVDADNEKCIARYNYMVETYNAGLGVFPTNIIAPILGYSALEPIVITEDDSTAPQFEDFKTPVFDIRKQRFNGSTGPRKLSHY